MSINLKIVVGDDIRRLKLDDTPSSTQLSTVKDQIVRLFDQQQQPQLVTVLIKFKDEDDDLVTVANASEWSEVLDTHRQAVKELGGVPGSKHATKLYVTFKQEAESGVAPAASAAAPSLPATVLPPVAPVAPSTPTAQPAVTKPAAVPVAESKQQETTQTPRPAAATVAPTGNTSQGLDLAVKLTSPYHRQHELTLTASPYGHNGYVCDVCQGSFGGQSFHCNKCTYDLCITCADPQLETGKLSVEEKDSEQSGPADWKSARREMKNQWREMKHAAKQAARDVKREWKQEKRDEKEAGRSQADREKLLDEMLPLALSFVSDPAIQRALPIALTVGIDAFLSGADVTTTLNSGIATNDDIKRHPFIAKLLKHLPTYLPKVEPVAVHIREVACSVDQNMINVAKSLIPAFLPQILVNIRAGIEQVIATRQQGTHIHRENVFNAFNPFLAGLPLGLGGRLSEMFAGFPDMADDTASESDYKSEAPADADITHRGVECDGCGMYPIRGKRFKCNDCRDFDLCSGCHAVRQNKHHANHTYHEVEGRSEGRRDWRRCGRGPRGGDDAGVGFMSDLFNTFSPFPFRGRGHHHGHHGGPPSHRGESHSRGRGRGGRHGGHHHGPHHHDHHGPPPPHHGHGPHHPHHHGPPPHSFAGWADWMRPPHHHRDQSEERPIAEFKGDVNYPDRSEVEAGSTIVKTWLIKNGGNKQWPVGTKLIVVRGDHELAAAEEFEVPLAMPGETVEVNAVLNLPRRAGRYNLYLRLADETRTPFGGRLWTDLIAVEKEPEAELDLLTSLPRTVDSAMMTETESKSDETMQVNEAELAMSAVPSAPTQNQLYPNLHTEAAAAPSTDRQQSGGHSNKWNVVIEDDDSDSSDFVEVRGVTGATTPAETPVAATPAPAEPVVEPTAPVATPAPAIETAATAAASPAAGTEDYSQHLSTLAELGFNNKALNLFLLRQNKGDIQTVITWLIERLN